MIYRQDKEEEEKQQVYLEESTSGKSRGNKWKKDEQQVERGIAKGGNVKSATSGSSQIAR